MYSKVKCITVYHSHVMRYIRTMPESSSPTLDEHASKLVLCVYRLRQEALNFEGSNCWICGLLASVKSVLKMVWVGEEGVIGYQLTIVGITT